MSKNHISIAIILIVLIIILSELHSNKTNQQIQNDRYKAEERLKNLFKEHFSDDPTIDPKNDSKIFYLKCIMDTGRNDTTTNFHSSFSTFVTVDEGRKHVSVNYLTEGTYTEKGNIIFAEHSHEGDPFVANRKKAHIVVLRLDKISGFLEIDKYEQSEGQKVGTPLHQMSYQCEKTEPVVSEKTEPAVR